MTDAIRAIVIDPTKRTIEEVMLPTEPGKGRTRIKDSLKTFYRLIGCSEIEMTYLAEGVLLTLDGEAAPESGPCDFWQYDNCEPIPGVGVLNGHDIMRAHYFDCPITLEEARAKIKFTKRIIRGMDVREERHGNTVVIRAERIAPIVEER
jgi:hypothetical protein